MTGDLMDECASCGEIMPTNECPKSLRPCGHHCNHSWSHDECHWCGITFDDETETAGAGAAEGYDLEPQGNAGWNYEKDG